MKDLFNIMTEKFFGIFLGTVALAILVISMQIALNLGYPVKLSTIYIGWLLVLIWLMSLTLLSLFQLVKKETEE